VGEERVKTIRGGEGRSVGEAEDKMKEVLVLMGPSI